jgi:hypothetical protein
MRRAFLLALVLAVLLPLLGVVVVLAALSEAQCGNGTPTANVTAPGGDPTTEAQFVRYCESQGIPANAAAGIVGNLYQESDLNPDERGGHLAQWNASWWALASAWISAHGQKSATEPDHEARPASSQTQRATTRGARASRRRRSRPPEARRSPDLTCS